jgi:FkbM family methyltransferase
MRSQAYREEPNYVRHSRSVLAALPYARYRAMNLVYATAQRLRWELGPFIATNTRHNSRFICHLADSVAREVCFTGRYEPVETAFVRRLLRPGSTFVDVGANWGYFSLFAAAIVGPEGRVLSLEPDPRLFRMLTANLALNEIGCVTAVQAAAADTQGELLLEGFDENGGNWGLSRLANRRQPGGFRVRADSLTSLLRDCAIENVRLMKVDIEGAEDLAVQGMADLLHRRRIDCLLLELHPEILAARGSSPDEIVSRLSGHGYRGWWIERSPATTRRWYYQDLHTPEELLRPLDAAMSGDAWPHTFWIRPGVTIDDLFRATN